MYGIKVNGRWLTFDGSIRSVTADHSAASTWPTREAAEEWGREHVRDYYGSWEVSEVPGFGEGNAARVLPFAEYRPASATAPTWRDELAARAVVGLMAGRGVSFAEGGWEQYLAEKAYRVADALIARGAETRGL